MMTLNQRLAEGVEIARDVVYAQMGGRALTLDLYWHPSVGEPEQSFLMISLRALWALR
jgi:hypothetical protein